MSKKIVLLLMSILFIVGATTGYSLFTVVPDFLLPPSQNEYTLVVTGPNELFITRILFSVLFAISFAAVPISALISNKFSSHANYSVMITSSGIIMALSMSVSVIYYKNYFINVLSMPQIVESAALELARMPYNQIPLYSITVTLLFGIFVYGFRKIVDNRAIK